MESAELIAILRDVRDRVRASNPETAAGGMDIALPDLTGLVHARDAALGKVAAIGTVNPRAGGPLNSLVQAWKRLVARALDWHVREQVEFNRRTIACVDAAIEALNQSNRALVEFGNRLAAERGQREELEKQLREQIAAQQILREELERRLREQIAAERARLEAEWARVEELEKREREKSQELSDIRDHWAQWRVGWEQKLATNEMQFLRSVADLDGAFQYRLTLMDSNYREAVRSQHNDFTVRLDQRGLEIQKRLWADLERVRAEFDKLIHVELRLIRQRSGAAFLSAAAPEASAPVPSRPAAPLAFDYARFAEAYRGSEERVRGGQRIYVADFKNCGNVLDIGCGRGEFLELMREAGVPSRGIDSSLESIALCREKGLPAEAVDLFDYLHGLGEGELDGIFCAQVVEHLPPERLPEMIRLAASRLERNGVIVIETPNPDCLAIFATYFYLDPTHSRPVPEKLLTFYLSEFGIGNLEVRHLEQAVDSMPSLAELPKDFREAFFGGLDYAIIGKKV
ncbi:MAG: class I SAM-dependent methyltransferase [Bryobacteraceae bacterium]